MSKASITSLAAAICMFVATGLAATLRPSHYIAEEGPKIELETLIPKQFGGWRTDETVIPVLPSPDTQAALKKIYSQTLARTYVNGNGDRIMLSIAYGGDQSDSMQVHKPEVCYPAQGFSILSTLKSRLATQFGQIPVRRLVAVHGPRVEPITYWITVGDHVARTGWEQKLAQLRYGLTGKIPDGMLFRVSSIDRDEVRAYEIQSQFIQSVLSNISASNRARLVGILDA